MNNPFEKHILYHYKLAYDVIPKKDIKVLDIGSGNAAFLSSLLQKTKHLYGYDVSQAVIARAKKNYPKITFTYGKPGKKLPYENNFFDVVVLFHVLEHVASEEVLVKEIKRILKKDGLLLLASPYKGTLTWMDMANLRYVFPRTHKFIYSQMWGKKQYEQLFTNNSSNLYGDSTKENGWHKHYTQEELTALLSEWFRIEKVHKFSFFHPILNLINISDSVIRKKDFLPVPFITEVLFYIDNRMRVGNASYNFFLAARKK